MIPELGHFSLILALLLALVQGILPLVGAARNIPAWMAVAKPAARAQFLFVAIAFGCLAYSFLIGDFSVVNVTRNSHSRLPEIYRFTATWGSHEGSMLLWTLILGLWTTAVTLLSRHLPEDMVARVVGVMGLVSFGFLLFMLATSNPFERVVLKHTPYSLKSFYIDIIGQLGFVEFFNISNGNSNSLFQLLAYQS